MLCLRCSHPLPSGADRCLRCFALNPQNRARAAKKLVPTPPGPSVLDSPASDPELRPLQQALPPSEPPRPLRASIASDPPPERAEEDDERFWLPPSTPLQVKPVLAPAVAEDAGDVELGNLDLSGPQPLLAEDAGTTLHFDRPLSHEAVTEPPEPADPLSMTLDEEPPPVPARAARVLKPRAPAQRWAPTGKRLLAWFVDSALLAICSAVLVIGAAQVVGPARLAPPGFGSTDYWLDLLRTARLPALWTALFACLALSYSWFFAALGGRTPGMSAAGLRLLRVSGEPVSAGGALGRAILSLISAAPALFGFIFSFFDARGQSLHDKLTGTALVRDE